MEFYLDYRKDDSYGRPAGQLKQCSKEELFKQLIIDTARPGHWYECYGIVSTVISRPVPRRWYHSLCGLRDKITKHILVLDCDGLDKTISASHILATRNVGYAAVSSSCDERSWLVTDITGTITELCDYAKGIPGADQQHISMSENDQVISVRLMPKRKTGLLPQFPASHSLTNPECLAWYSEFIALYGCEQMRWIQSNILMKEALSEGRVIDAAASPDFKL